MRRRLCFALVLASILACVPLLYAGPPCKAAEPQNRKIRTADDWIQLAELQSRSGDHEAAIVSLRNALRIDPRRGTLYERLGDELSIANREREAIDAYVRCGEQTNYSAAILTKIGSEYFRLKDYGNAHEYLSRSFVVDANRFETWMACAEVYSATGDHVHAVEYVTKALTFPQGDSFNAAIVQFGAAGIFERAGRPRERRDALQAAAELWPCYGFYFELGKAQEGDHLLVPAADSYEKAITHQPNNPEAHYRLGYVRALAFKWELAEREQRTLLRLDRRLARELRDHIDRIKRLPGIPGGVPRK